LNLRRLCDAGPMVSEIGFGGGPLRGRDWGPVDDPVSLEAVHRALDLGVTFFDTADAYGNGHSERILGKALAGERGRVVLATKGGWWYSKESAHSDFSPNYLHRALDRSLDRLQTDYVDLYQIHDPDEDALRSGEIFEVMAQMKTVGKIRYSGVSVDTVEEGLRCIDTGSVDVLQVYYNILDQRPDQELFEAATASGVGLVAKTPLGRGLLTGKYRRESKFHKEDFRFAWQKEGKLERLLDRIETIKGLMGDRSETLAQTALRFILGSAAISSAIPGAKTPEQVEANVKASRLGPLEDRELRALKSYFRNHATEETWN